MKNVTRTYKKADDTVKLGIDKEAKEIASDLKIADRMECYADRNAFVTLKDHKDNFQNNPKCRLLNPAKSEVGIVSKNMLGRINTQVLKAIKVNQWRSTSTVIQWFKNIEDKPESKLIKFDIVDFYPSISENLLEKALAWAKKYVNISDKEM